MADGAVQVHHQPGDGCGENRRVHGPGQHPGHVQGAAIEAPVRIEQVPLLGKQRDQGRRDRITRVFTGNKEG